MKRHPILTFSIALSTTVIVASATWIARKPAVPSAIYLASGLQCAPKADGSTFGEDSDTSPESGISRHSETERVGWRDRDHSLAESFPASADRPRQAMQTSLRGDETPGRGKEDESGIERSEGADLESPTSIRAAQASGQANPQTVVQTAAASIPLAFQEPSREITSDPQKAAVLENLRQDFVDAVGGPNQDPADPAYLDRWLSAQALSDEQFRIRFGDEAYLAMQMQISNQ